MSNSISLKYNLNQKQSLKQNQKLMMSEKMQQGIQLLQMPLLELESIIAAELSQNPVLEMAEEYVENSSAELCEEALEDVEEDHNAPLEKELSFTDQDLEILKHLDQEYRDHFSESENYYLNRGSDEEKERAYLESLVQNQLSLFGLLMKQAKDVFETDEELKIAEIIIGNLDEKGFLSVSAEEIALLNDLDLKQVKEVLEDIQSFEPYGVGAKDLRESLLIQLTCLRKKHSLAYKIVKEHYDDLLYHRIPLLRKCLSCSQEEIQRAISLISKLSLRPGVHYSKEMTQYIQPDLQIIEENGMLKIEVNESFIPSIRINSRYLRMLEDESLSNETKQYIREKLMSGKWLMRNLSSRNQTLYRLGEFLVKHQAEFFLKPEGKIAPMLRRNCSCMSRQSQELCQVSIFTALGECFL